MLSTIETMSKMEVTNAITPVIAREINPEKKLLFTWLKLLLLTIPLII